MIKTIDAEAWQEVHQYSNEDMQVLWEQVLITKDCPVGASILNENGGTWENANQDILNAMQEILKNTEDKRIKKIIDPKVNSKMNTWRKKHGYSKKEMEMFHSQMVLLLNVANLSELKTWDISWQQMDVNIWDLSYDELEIIKMGSIPSKEIIQIWKDTFDIKKSDIQDAWEEAVINGKWYAVIYQIENKTWQESDIATVEKVIKRFLKKKK